MNDEQREEKCMKEYVIHHYPSDANITIASEMTLASREGWRVCSTWTFHYSAPFESPGEHVAILLKREKEQA